jgi:hypothetical protein
MSPSSQGFRGLTPPLTAPCSTPGEAVYAPCGIVNAGLATALAA